MKNKLLLASHYRRRWLAVLSGVLLLAAGNAAAQPHNWDIDIVRDTFGYGGDTPSDVSWDELVQGCGRRDCIPSIDKPRFVAASDADFLGDEDVVMALRINGEARAYPVAILNYHEIVNDVVAGRPVAVTYCPLCGSGLVFERTFDGKAVEFGVSGLLRNNDLVLYDRATESLWQQITGRAFAGPLRGGELVTVPVAMTRWGTWRAAHPGTRVLSLDTGFDRPYANKTPYGDYDSSDRLLFPVALDRRLHPKTVVYGVEIGQSSFAVTERALEAERIIMSDREPLLRWELLDSGQVKVEHGDTGEQLVPHRMFWFAWFSFHIDTSLYDGEDTN
ncbi:MAG: DUF3179 domain-containing protein [Gammaproteobacteria bacterium]